MVHQTEKPDPRYHAYRVSLSRAALKCSPSNLYLRGESDLIYGSRVRCAVVGSRDASPEGMMRAAEIARACVANGHVVVSGLAKGVDAAAHRAAISAGGRTIGVIGTPLESVYPREHADLQASIARDHLLVSQFAEPPGPRGFVIRNRTIAILSCAAFVPEAGAHSGARHVVEAMQKFGREVYIHESVLSEHASAEWVRRALHYGAISYAAADVPAVVANIERRSRSMAPALSLFAR